MPTTISRILEKPFATTQREPSTAHRYTMTATSEHGTCHHDFVDLDCAISKMRELMVLGFIDLSLKRSTCHTSGE